MRTERGFALVVVLLVMAIVGVVGAEFAHSMRLEAAAVRAYKAGIVASHLAEAAVAQAVREMVGDFAYVALDEQGLLVFYTVEGLARPPLPREKVDFAGGQYSYQITDEEARINLNASPPERVDRLLQFCLGLDKSARDMIGDSLQDWRDANEDYRLNGGESEDYYLKLPLPYRAHNANLESVAELLQVRGITPALYRGTDDRPGLVDLVTVKSPGQQININTATPCAMTALGLAEAEITEIVQSRALAPFAAVPGKFGVRGFAVTTRTFRVEAQGIVDGRVSARLTAIVQKRAEGIVVLDWSAGL